MEELNVEQIYIGTMAFIVVMIIVVFIMTKRFEKSLKDFDDKFNIDYYQSFPYKLSDNNTTTLTKEEEERLVKRYIVLADKKLNDEITWYENHELDMLEYVLEENIKDKR